ncbi:uncharacterized protein A1O5_00761 [Cladophialophora psammophila CBS 110553]|uniref:VWFA domain-containing protein n=1 Tax=Cladophialophora psammophila CBS 110553 TaxID=1182543 RepID=W9X7N9_9EURO|nr:uncharacterized protein A1O5_00761 [Cladophialophora psammophila CBS 110553]EXJ76253.1 hypothetical protein A1O5_00761 [Cladophialophora psammophila CBS 110553]
MATPTSQFVEKFTQRLTSILGDPTLRILLENHLNRSMDSIDKINPDSLDKHIGALSERSATEMIQKFPSMLQERIQSPTVRDEPKQDENVARRTVSKHITGKPSGGNDTRDFDDRGAHGVFRTKSPFDGSQASTLIPQRQHPYQRPENHYSPDDQPNQGVDFSHSSFIPGSPSVHPKLEPISELGSKNPESDRNKAVQVIGDGSSIVNSAEPYSKQQEGTARGTKNSFPIASSSQGQFVSNPTRSSATVWGTNSGAPLSETRHSNICEEPPLSGTSESKYAERPLTPVSGTSESNYEERPLTPLSDDSERIYVEVTKSPQKSQEYLSRTIETTRLTGFYGKDHPRVQTVALNAAARANEITTKYHLTPKTTLGVIKLALYNFVVLCDDSTSMRQEQRIPALKTTLNRVAEIATMLEETGISIRFLNYNRDSRLDDLRHPDAIMRKVESIRFKGITRLGNVLHEKIIEPMIIDKATRGTFEAPLVVVIITDGEPNHEDRGTLRNMIRECKQKLSSTDFGDGSVVFIISRVGSSPEAMEFIEELENGPGVEQMVYCSKDRLDEKMAILQRAAGNYIEYSKFSQDLQRGFDTGSESIAILSLVAPYRCKAPPTAGLSPKTWGRGK